MISAGESQKNCFFAFLRIFCTIYRSAIEARESRSKPTCRYNLVDPGFSEGRSESGVDMGGVGLTLELYL